MTSLLNELVRHCAARWSRGLLLAALLAARPASALAPLPGEYLEGSITVSYSGARAWNSEDGETRTAKSYERKAVHHFWFRASEAETRGDVMILRGHVSDVHAYAHGQEKSTSRDGESLMTQDGGVSVTCPGGGQLGWLCDTGTVYMVVDAKSRTYNVAFNTIPVPTQETTIRPSLGDEPSTPETVEGHTIHVPGFELGGLALPQPGARLTGSRTIAYTAFEGRNIQRPKAMRKQPIPKEDSFLWYEDDEHDPGPTITVTWDIGPPQLLEVILEPVAYENWIPEGNLQDAAKAGNDLTIKAKLQRKDDPSAPVDKEVRLTFKLEKVSFEPGVCLNWPPKATLTRGLQLLQKENPDYDVAGPEEAKQRRAAKETSIKVSAFDFGAWGRLKAQAVTSDGQEIPVKYKGEEDPSIPLPLYHDNEHIALAWLKEKGMAGKTADSDEETQPVGNGTAGDGLTLYEEYRGFSVQGTHLRLDPKRKDLFLCDDTGGLAQGGIGLFLSLTDLEVHQLTRDELGPDRVVNRNHDQAPHAVDQHGLLITKGPAGSSPIAVGTWGPPKTTQVIRIPENGHYTATGGADSAFEDMTADVAHELCHGVDVKHHGDGSLHPVLYAWKADPSGTFQFYEHDVIGDSDTPEEQLQVSESALPVRLLREANGSEFRKGDAPPKGFGWDARLGGYLTYAVSKQGECSGAEECIVRYPDKGVFYSDSDPAVRYIPDPAQKPHRTKLCRSPEGTGINAGSHKPQSRYGDAPAGRGNCLGQIMVNDRYAP